MRNKEVDKGTYTKANMTRFVLRHSSYGRNEWNGKFSACESLGNFKALNCSSWKITIKRNI